MKQKQNTGINFEGQAFYIGIDVHKKSWKVTIRSQKIELETYSQPPDAEGLFRHLHNRYPGGIYFSVYEAGFCGYHIDRKLKELGIENIVINPADVPTSNKEKSNKSDKVDSRKLSRELESGSLTGIYIPSEFQIELRSLSRLRYQLVKEQTRLKNRIKAYLYFHGRTTLATQRYWSSSYISRMREIRFDYEMGNQYLEICLDSLEICRNRIAEVLKKLRIASDKFGFNEILTRLIKGVPGIGFITAITLYSEIMDMKRFKSIEKLASYVGIVPSVKSSGEKEYTSRLTQRKSKYLRYLLIEASWIAIRKDEALFIYYSNLLKRMSNKRAIISVARKLLNRVRHVWLNNEDYVLGLVE